MKKALLVIDIQNDYFENGNMQLVNSEEASENAKMILEKFRSDKLPVIHVQHIATRPDATFFYKGDKRC
ncbi:isochorismatase family protein [Flavobacterium sp. JLP]|uniref:isochorismatase family protein n=1 Tax=Flavobacterium sp. JLP TaxID=2783793 RepID=UPI00293C03C8|nr:isochorismatase family protein [Flavobacterium sp. JLP]